MLGNLEASNLNRNPTALLHEILCQHIAGRVTIPLHKTAQDKPIVVMSSGNLGSGSGGTSPYDDANSNGGSGAPLPDFNASNIRLATIAPAFGIPSSSLTAGPGSSHLSNTRTPDYLDYDQKGRGTVSTMFTNSGISYLIGVSLGGLYGLREGLTRTPSSRWKVKLNSVLNHCGRHGSGWGNMMGSTAILYSLYEGIADTVSFILLFLVSPSYISFHFLFIDPHIFPEYMYKHIQYELDRYTGPIQPPAPLLAGALTGATYYIRAGPRVATLAGAIGTGVVGGTFALYSVLGIPYGSKGWLFL